MHAEADKQQGRKRRSGADEVAPRQGGAVYAGPSARPEILAQQELQELADRSPHVAELHAIQRMADESARAKEAAGAVAQRVVKIKKPKLVKYANLPAFKKSKDFAPLVEQLMAGGFSEEQVLFHLGQMFSTDVEFEDQQHFKEALLYDIANKSMPDEEHTLQEQYMTEYGWKKRSTAKGKRGAASGGQQLKVYRTMPVTEYEQLAGGDPSALVGGHLGDFKQAHNYLYRDRNSPDAKPKVLVEFTLKAGAERHLFSPQAMALPAAKHKRAVPELLRKTMVHEGAADTFPEANVNEGTARDFVGIKSEAGEAGFSLGIGGGTSWKLFMSMVESTKVVGRSHPEEEVEEEEQLSEDLSDVDESEGVGIGAAAALATPLAASSGGAGAIRALPDELLYAHAAGFRNPGALALWRQSDAFRWYEDMVLTFGAPIHPARRNALLQRIRTEFLPAADEEEEEL